MINKRILLYSILLLSIVSCNDLIYSPDENYPDFTSWLSVINSDLTNFKKCFEVTYNYTDLIGVKNFLITPDESYVILNRGLNGIWRYNINGTNPLKLSDSLWVRETQLAISSNGLMIAFTARGDIYRVNINGSSLMQLTNTPNDYEDHPDFSHNDNKIIYTKVSSYCYTILFHSICKMNIDGDEQEELLSNKSKGEQLFTYPISVENTDLILFNKLEETSALCSYSINNKSIVEIFTGSIPNKRISVNESQNKILAANNYIINLEGDVLFDIKDITNKYHTEGEISKNGAYAILNSNESLFIFNFTDNSYRFLQRGNSPICINERIYFIWHLN
jgi:Tol biopolymer transport system component